jgi:hypothetical protein
MPVYGAGFRRRLGRDSGLDAPQPPAIPIAAYRAWQFPLHPYSAPQFPLRPYNLPHGRSSTLVATFVLYGAALIRVPRILRAARA